MLLIFAASLPPNMGDSILASLSLPPSGRVASNQPTGASGFSAEQSNGPQLKDATPFIRPVISLIANEDVPVMMSSAKKASSSKDTTNETLVPLNKNVTFTSIKEKQKTKENGVKEGQEVKEKRTLNQSGGMKRKLADKTESFSDIDEEEEEVFGAKRRTNEREEDGARSVRNEACDRKLLTTCMSKLGVKRLDLPEDPFLCSIFAKCLTNQPRVVVEKLLVASSSTCRSGRGGKSLYVEENLKRKLAMHPRTSSSHYPDLNDKE